MTRRHVMTSGFLGAVVSGAVTVGILIGGVVAGVAYDSRPSVVHTPAVVSAGDGYRITEDDARWDCLRMGNLTCRVDGVLMTSIEDMPGVEAPYDRCLFLMAISARVSEFGYAPELCEPVATNGG